MVKLWPECPGCRFERARWWLGTAAVALLPFGALGCMLSWLATIVPNLESSAPDGELLRALAVCSLPWVGIAALVAGRFALRRRAERVGARPYELGAVFRAARLDTRCVRHGGHAVDAS